MNTELILEKSYTNAVFINYVEGTQLFLLRCIHNLYKNSKKVECVIVSVNDVLKYDFKEDDFFDSLKDMVKDKFDLYVIRGTEPSEAFQQSYVFTKLLENMTYRAVYLHSDCFVQTDIVDEMITTAEQNPSYYLVANAWKKSVEGEAENYDFYTGNNHLFLMNLYLCDMVYKMNDKETFTGGRLMPEEMVANAPDRLHKVDSGLGNFAHWAVFNKDKIKTIDFTDKLLHRGASMKSHSISVEHYSIFNDVFFFKESLGWLIKNSKTPMFMNFICYKQYSFLTDVAFKYRDDPAYIEKFNGVDWMVSEEMISKLWTNILPVKKA